MSQHVRHVVQTVDAHVYKPYSQNASLRNFDLLAKFASLEQCFTRNVSLWPLLYSVPFMLDHRFAFLGIPLLVAGTPLLVSPFILEHRFCRNTAFFWPSRLCWNTASLGTPLWVSGTVIFWYTWPLGLIVGSFAATRESRVRVILVCDWGIPRLGFH